MMPQLFPIFGTEMQRKTRRYRSIKREFRATYTSPSNFGADVAGQPRPPVRHRSKYKMWRW